MSPLYYKTSFIFVYINATRSRQLPYQYKKLSPQLRDELGAGNTSLSKSFHFFCTTIRQVSGARRL